MGIFKRVKDSAFLGTVVVPTYKEHGNLKALTERLFIALQKSDIANVELVIVDDNSQDGSERLVEELSKTYPVRIIVRKDERGLSSAVLKGFSDAIGKESTQWVLCMDADLQHPPEKVPEMINALAENEFVIGTRYGGGNSVDENWPMYRRVISAVARLMARPLTPLSDPMTGFFGLRASTLKRGKSISPIGFKICLELYVKCQVKSHAEVPIVFGVRTEGESKLSSKVIVGYLKHLLELYWFKMPILFFLFPLLVVIVLIKLCNF